MPITKSVKKALASSKKKRSHNLILEEKLKKSLKKVDKNNVNEVISLIDKIAKSGLIHRNKAARLKSRLAKKFGTPKINKKVSPKTTIKTSKTKIVKKVKDK